MSYLDELNEPQRAAVEYIDGPALVIAGAGSGKTRVLTYKIMHLLQSGYKPWNILAITFTNKAAREMKERIAKKIGEEDASKLWMGTFHSVFYKILRVEAEKIGYGPNITIYDTDDAKSLIKSIVKEMGLDPKQYTPGFILNRISMAKSSLLSAQ
ncbi:MAG: UvrD-helicase domain-containing protein, partial [Bacteroidales bacterium]|nr:UvrD-helicase domain-containing protein [Bacteroidales bacterium]